MKTHFCLWYRLIRNRVRLFFQNAEAATSVEYAVMLALILIVTISAISEVGHQTGGMWSGIIQNLQEIGFIP